MEPKVEAFVARNFRGAVRLCNISARTLVDGNAPNGSAIRTARVRTTDEQDTVPATGHIAGSDWMTISQTNGFGADCAALLRPHENNEPGQEYSFISHASRGAAIAWRQAGDVEYL